MTALERMARAMAVADGEDPDMFTWGMDLNKAGPPVWTHYVKCVRAALLAIREPDEAMISAYCEAVAPEYYLRSIRPGFIAMIDAILNETPE